MKTPARQIAAALPPMSINSARIAGSRKLRLLLGSLTLAFASQVLAQPAVDGNRVYWPANGWYQVQNAETYKNVCEGGTECRLQPGRYNVINHDTGERWGGLEVAAAPATRKFSLPDGGWYQIQRASDYHTVCEGTGECELSPGYYNIINHSTGKRWRDIEVGPGEFDFPGISVPSVPPADHDSELPGESPGYAIPERLVLNLVGRGYMYEDLVPAADGLGGYVNAWCFDVDLIDMRRGQSVGSATDCLDPSLSPDKLSASGLGMIGTTYFNLPQGTLAIQGRTTVQPRNWPTRQFTHITGGNSAGNAVLYGTGAFEGKTGTVRLSGMVDMSGFDQSVGSPIEFDCIFVLDLS